MTGGTGEGATVRGRGTWLTHWVSDLRLGVRLAIGGGRTSKTGVARLVLSTIGIGIAVAVLLVGASAGPLFAARTDRQAAQYISSSPLPGVDPLYERSGNTTFRGKGIHGSYLRQSGPRAPLPPGVTRLPGDGEMVVSPALAELLSSPEGELLRPRFPERIIGTIGEQGVVDSRSLTFYIGDSSLPRDGSQQVYAYGGPGPSREIPPTIIVLIAIGTVVLLVPVFVFVGTSARIAGAERDRRLAALRLVGADARQARRIAAAESLVSAGTGLAFGIGLFLVFRSLIGNFPILGVSAYPDDLTPPWPLAVLILLLVPLLAVFTAQIALRRTIIEPLGVVRRGRPTRRRLWWRLAPVVVGPLILLSQVDGNPNNETWLPVVVTGTALLLLGIPAMLPWLLERVVAKMRGGRPSAQLAIRRLQLDSGTPARVVAGVAVVLAGAIALQAVLASQTSKYDGAYQNLSRYESMMLTSIDGEIPEAMTETVRAVPGIGEVVHTRTVDARGGDNIFSMAIVGCEVLLRYLNVERCADGEVFRLGPPHQGDLAPGQVVTMVNFRTQGERTGDRWTVPAEIREASYAGELYFVRFGSLLVTPGALAGVRLPGVTTDLAIRLDSAAGPDVVEQVRNAVAPLRWQATTYTIESGFSSPTLELFLTVRSALLGGALFTLLLAGVSMLVLALEQVRERRRPLAALAASGVPTGTLARSLLWQNVVPVLLAVLVAIATGVGLAQLVFQLISEPFIMDWLSVAWFSGAAAVLALFVTALTLPTLRSATRLMALRTE